jgi:hypothetical protein
MELARILTDAIGCYRRWMYKYLRCVYFFFSSSWFFYRCFMSDTHATYDFDAAPNASMSVVHANREGWCRRYCSSAVYLLVYEAALAHSHTASTLLSSHHTRSVRLPTLHLAGFCSVNISSDPYVQTSTSARPSVPLGNLKLVGC